MLIKNENAARAAKGKPVGFGWLALYQGLWPALLGSAISWGGYFYFYEAGKKALTERKQKEEQNKTCVTLNSFDHLTAAW